MKRMLALLLAAALLLSGCNLLPAEVTDPLPDANGTHKENADPGSQAPRIDQNTGIALHDNAPDLAEAGIEEYLAYFQESADFVNMPDFRDERNPYEERLAAEKEALGKNFEEYYLEQSTMIAYFENFVEKHLDAYNEDKDYYDSVFLYLIAFQSMELAIGSSFTEEDDWAMLQRGMVMATEMFGGTNATVTRNAAHNYTITYNDSGAQVVDHFRADLGGGIQMLCYTDGELTEIFEFKELGNDTYAWQNNRERMVMTFKDKTVLSCWYSSLSDKATRYGEADLIFGSEVILDQNWVAQRADFRNHIRFDGKLLDITASNSGWGFAENAQIVIGEK